jgi:hypothetical protein
LETQLPLLEQLVLLKQGLEFVLEFQQLVAVAQQLLVLVLVSAPVLQLPELPPE